MATMSSNDWQAAGSKPCGAARRRQQHDLHAPMKNEAANGDDAVPLQNIQLKPLRPDAGSRRGSAHGISQIDQVLCSDDIDLDTHGAFSETRDGFFDAIFHRPLHLDFEKLLVEAGATLPREFDKASPLAARHFLSRQFHQLHSLLVRVATSRAGIRLVKACLAYFAAYASCLVPAAREWLGRYHYMIAISVVLNHPARTVGGQVEGMIFTSLGTAIGLGWGVIGLLLSTSTLAASAGFGAILALFLASIMLVLAWLRASFIRFYQIVLCAGLAVMFTMLAETNSHDVSWDKLRSYAVPWLLGQATALLINLLIYPDAGARALAVTLHEALAVMQETLEVNRLVDNRSRRRLARAFINLSEAYRDMRMNLTISRFQPAHVKQLRNIMQAVIRALLSLESKSQFLEYLDLDQTCVVTVDGPDTLKGHDRNHDQLLQGLYGPTKNLLSCMKEGVQRCDAALMELSGYRRHLGPPRLISSHLDPVNSQLEHAKAAFDTVEVGILDSSKSSPSANHEMGPGPSTKVGFLVFARHVREAVSRVEALLDQVASMQRVPEWPQVYLPSYPIRKAVHRTNAQVRHDRGGGAASSYRKTFTEIAQLFDKSSSLGGEGGGRNQYSDASDPSHQTEAQNSQSHAGPDAPKTMESKEQKLGYKVWKALSHLGGFEGKYAFKVCLVVSLLSIPSYLSQSAGWWDEYEAWWAVVMSWAVMHPTVGGNVQDLVTRSGLALFGAVWSGIGYAAGHGNPFVMAAFAAAYMIPMLYRFTLSSHPRSGLAACLSFTVISLGLQARGGGPSPAMLAALKGLAFFLGTAVPIMINWVLWPFIARHELRMALSSMMIFMSILYRDVVSQYVYFGDGKEPTAEDIQRSEKLEGRLREGFVRIRQLLVLTRHEIRLRAPFDPLPYSGLANACERFFDHLITLRQSAMFYNPSYVRDHPTAAAQLLSCRRDAVAAVLGDLYILAGALRSQRKVPLYMPSAAAARKRLLSRTAEVRHQMSKQSPTEHVNKHQTWSDIYSYSYHESLTGCVAELEEMEKYTKIIVGQHGFDDEFSDEEEAHQETQAEESHGRS